MHPLDVPVVIDRRELRALEKRADRAFARGTLYGFVCGVLFAAAILTIALQS